MNKIGLLFLSIYLFLTVFVFPSLGQTEHKRTAVPGPGQNLKIRKINELIEKYAGNQLFNGSVLIEEKGRVIFKKGYGAANMEWNIPNSPATKFRIGSITKQFTAMLILQLAEEGRLDLQAPMTKYLTWYRKDTGNRITVHHLLTHESGIPNYTADAAVMRELAAHHYSPQEAAEKFCSGDLEFTPGTKMVYDNSGYFLLGVIIEAVTKKTYEENLRERIFTPLGMKNSGIDQPSVILKNRAAGYSYSFEGYQNSDYIDMETATFSAGAIYSTVEDLDLWERAMFGGRLLSKENKKLILMPNLGNYGYGLYISRSKPPGWPQELTVIGHHGGIDGFSALLIRFVETETTVILLDNTRSEKRGNLENISLAAFQILHELPAAKIKKSIQAAMIEKMRAGAGGTELAAFYTRAKNESQGDYDLSGAESFLNNLGYYLLGKDRVKDAIAVLKLAVEEYPSSANTFDTYAEALMKDGQKEAAVKNYRRSLELNPKNTNAVEQLKILEKGS